MQDAWVVEEAHATTSQLHELVATNPAARLLRWCRPVDAALVISRAQAQKPSNFNDSLRNNNGINLVTRSSGGGAVLVSPSEMLWFDVFVPVNDSLWEEDVSKACWWLGDVASQALSKQNFDVQVHRGAMVNSQVASEVCFAGLGPGEVMVGGRKAVGISQRRTRYGAWFQTNLYLRHDTQLLASIVAGNAADELEIHAELARCTTDLPGLDGPAFEADLTDLLNNL